MRIISRMNILREGKKNELTWGKKEWTQNKIITVAVDLLHFFHMVLNMPRYIHLLKFCVSNSFYIQFQKWEESKTLPLESLKQYKIVNFEQCKANPPPFIFSIVKTFFYWFKSKLINSSTIVLINTNWKSQCYSKKFNNH